MGGKRQLPACVASEAVTKPRPASNTSPVKCAVSRYLAISLSSAALSCPRGMRLLELGEFARELARKLADERGLCIQQDDPRTETAALIEQRDVFGQSAEQSAQLRVGMRPIQHGDTETGAVRVEARLQAAT